MFEHPGAVFIGPPRFLRNSKDSCPASAPNVKHHSLRQPTNILKSSSDTIDRNDNAMIRPSASRSRSRPSRPNQPRTASFAPSLRRRNTSASVQSYDYDDPEAASTAQADAAIASEIAEIKRYEDFTTIDWVQDAARESLRRKARRKARLSQPAKYTGRVFLGRGRGKWRRKIAEAYDAGQAWIVVTLVGAAIGLNAAFLNIVTEWLSDIKLGHCSTAFYLNESFCCWCAEGGCPEWKRWSGVWPVN